MDLGRPGSDCEDEAGTGECCCFLGGGVEDCYAREAPPRWGAGDGGWFEGLVEVDVGVGLAALQEEAAEEEGVAVELGKLSLLIMV